MAGQEAVDQVLDKDAREAVVDHAKASTDWAPAKGKGK
jgi:hypothetical protein